ncbi:MAG: glutamate formimidoyltransferase [Anaerolineales bacterium]|nr:glutamate formimidoyltransferase [Anaerolineales bacterium]
MSKKIIGCIANYSEGRRIEIIDEIASVIEAIQGVSLLDISSDSDHNRSVITFVGSPEEIEEAAFQSIARAAALIDMDIHRGEHPRLGATDVVPFVPISNATLEDCVEIAKTLGKRVGENLKIPVFLYEEAASHPEKVNLANIRKGEYEELKKEIGINIVRTPDFGPLEVGKAGGVVIGARAPLVAYNIYLTTDNVDVAKSIAKAVRFSSGGLAYVKALGMLVEGRAQVSMNLTNFEKTPIFRVVEMIRREAAQFGVNIHSSEIVGLIPQKALVDSALWYLQLNDFKEDQILENRIEKSRDDDNSLDTEFMEAVSRGEPTPGGGSASAYSAAMGAALVGMVGRLTLGKQKYAEVEDEMNVLIKDADSLRVSLASKVQEDAEAFEALMKAFRMAKETDKDIAKRNEAIEKASIYAAEVPLKVAEDALTILNLCLIAAEKGNVNAITDTGTGAAIAKAAIQGAGLNVRINLQNIDNPQKEKILGRLNEIQARADELEQAIQAQLSTRANL